MEDKKLLKENELDQASGGIQENSAAGGLVDTLAGGKADKLAGGLASNLAGGLIDKLENAADKLARP